MYFNRVSPGYFSTMRTPILLGRDFSMHDDAAAPSVIVITESAARRFFGSANALGKIIRAETAPHKEGVFQVIGVVKDIKYEQVDEKTLMSAFVASEQDTEPFSDVTFEVRSRAPVEAFVPAVRAAIGEVNRGISLEFRNFETQIDDSLLQARMVALLSAFFGGWRCCWR